MVKIGRPPGSDAGPPQGRCQIPVRLAVRFGMDPADPYGLTPEQRAAIGLLMGEIGIGRGRLKFSRECDDNIS